MKRLRCNEIRKKRKTDLLKRIKASKKDTVTRLDKI